MPATVTESSLSGVSVPRFELDFEGLKTRMLSFQEQFGETLQHQRQMVNNEHKDFARLVVENNETEKLLKMEIETSLASEADLGRERAKELQELQQTRSAIAGYSSKREQLLQQQDKYQAEISELRRQITQYRNQKQTSRQAIAEQSGLNSTELNYWQELLGLRIQGVKEDILKFIFSNLDGSDTECHFVLDISETDYKVTESKPQLESEVLQDIVKQLNTHRQLNVFLRDFRRAFKRARA